MEVLKVIILGIIQGITEWLPVSSTGHMLLFDELMPLHQSAEFVSVFMVVVQLGSVLAVVVLFFRKLWPFGKEKSETRRTLTLWGKVLIASIPAGAAGLLFDDVIDSRLSVWPVIAAALALYGIAYIILEKCVRIRTRINSVDELTVRDSLIMGAFQMLALIPGTSRSGSTILGGMITGVSRPAAAEFSFFMALPVMAGASLLRLVKSGFGFTAGEWGLLFLGALVAFLVSLAVIKHSCHIRRKNGLCVVVYRDCRICPPQECLCVVRPVVKLGLYFNVCFSGVKRETCHDFRAVHLIHISDCERDGSVFILIHLPAGRHIGCRTVMLRPVEFYASADPWTEETDKRRFDDFVVVNEIIAVCLVKGPLDPSAERGKDHYIDIFILEDDSFIFLIFLFIHYLVDDRIGINPAAASLIDSFLKEHRILVRLSCSVCWNGYGSGIDFCIR